MTGETKKNTENKKFAKTKKKWMAKPKKRQAKTKKILKKKIG